MWYVKLVFHTNKLNLHIEFVLSISTCWLNWEWEHDEQRNWFISELSFPPLPIPIACLCFDLFHPLRTSRCFSDRLLFLEKGSFIWEKSPISDQRFALMQIFINLRGRCGLCSSPPFLMGIEFDTVLWLVRRLTMACVPACVCAQSERPN